MMGIPRILLYVHPPQFVQSFYRYLIRCFAPVVHVFCAVLVKYWLGVYIYICVCVHIYV